MQIEIYTPTQEQAMPPVAWNYDEVKTWLTESLEKYKGLVYTSDTISQAKSDRAKLNKLADAIDGKRKEMKAYYLAPYEDFDKQAKELTALVKGVSASIDVQVKTFDEQRKAEKQEKILAIYLEKIGDLAEIVPYERLHNPKWLNVTANISAIEKELSDRIDGITSALASIDAMPYDAEILSAVKRKYCETLDLSVAVMESERITKHRESMKRYESVSREPQGAPVARETAQGSNNPYVDQSEVLCVDFRVHATPAQLNLLKSFLNENGIKYGRVPNGS